MLPDTATNSIQPPPAAAWELLERIIAEYHALLQQPQVADGLADSLRQRMQQEKLIFGGRLLSPYLRPNFLTRSQFNYVGAAIKEMMDAIEVVEKRALSEPDFLHRMALSEGEARLVAIEPGLRRFSAKSRMDTFLTPDSFKFVEYNAESPAGIGYGDMLQNVFMETAPMQLLTKKYPISKAQSRGEVLATLLAAWHEWGGKGKPRLGIVDYLDVPTVSEFHLFQEFFQSQGYETVVADPRSLELRDGKLMAGDFHIELLYRRVLVNELLERIDECAAMVKACETRAVCMVNSFRAKLLHKKLLFAVLWAPDMQQHFSEAQQAAIRRHVPWTWHVQDGWAEYDGKKIDLVDFVRAERNRLVLKPNDEYGGKGVIIGWEASEQLWEQALQEALLYPHVVQEKVPVARTDFPDLDGNVAPRVVDLDPFIFTDRVTGCLTRLSDTSLCNVTSGGGQVPTFIVED